MGGGRDVTDLKRPAVLRRRLLLREPSKVASRLKRDLNKSATGKVIHGAAIGARLYVHSSTPRSPPRLAVARAFVMLARGVSNKPTRPDVLNFSSGGSNDLLKL